MATTQLALPDLHSLLDRPQFQYYALITTYPFLFHSPQLTHYSLPPPIAMPLSSAFSRGHLLRCISKLNNVKIILSYPPQPNRDAYKQVPLHFFILPSFCLFVNIAMQFIFCVNQPFVVVSYFESYCTICIEFRFAPIGPDSLFGIQYISCVHGCIEKSILYCISVIKIVRSSNEPVFPVVSLHM